MDWVFVQGELCKGMFRVGFPLLLNKALKWDEEIWIWGFYNLDSLEDHHVRIG